MAFSSLKVVELKELLKEKGLPVGGLKAELVKRLEQAEAEAEQPAADQEARLNTHHADHLACQDVPTCPTGAAKANCGVVAGSWRGPGFDRGGS